MNIGQVLPIKNEKDYEMEEICDDRAVQLVTNTGQTISETIYKLYKEYEEEVK